MQTLNPFWKARFFWAFLFAVSVCLFMCSCNPARQIEKAEQTVITHPQSLRNVGLVWLSFNPCANDTTISYLMGHTDTLLIDKVISLPMLDTSKNAATIDSLQSLYATNCNKAINDAFDLGMETASKEFAKIKIPVKRPDTAKYMILDKQAWNLLDDSLQRAERHISGLEAQNTDQREVVANERKTANKWLWYFIAACVGLAVTNAFWIYTKIKV